MSAGAVRAFLPQLRRLDADLPVPVGRRVQVLRELEADLEAFAEHLERSGVPAAEARRRALEALVPAGTALDELGRVHASPYRRLARVLGEARVRAAERSALILVTGAVLIWETQALLDATLFQGASPFVWVVAALATGMFVLALSRAFRLWIRGDDEAVGRGSAGLLAGAVTIVFVGVGGSLIELYRFAGIVSAAPELYGALALDWLLRVAFLLALSLMVALATALAWFVMAQWCALVSHRRGEFLGLSPDPRRFHPSTEVPSDG